MKTPALVDELRTATAVRKESDLPRVVQFWAMRASCLNEDVIVERIREAAKEGNFTKPRFPFFRRRIEGSLPLDFRADFIGGAEVFFGKLFVD